MTALPASDTPPKGCYNIADSIKDDPLHPDNLSEVWTVSEASEEWGDEDCIIMSDYRKIYNSTKVTQKGRYNITDLMQDGSLILDLPNGQILDICARGSYWYLDVDLRDGLYNSDAEDPNDSLGCLPMKGVMKEKEVYKDGLYVTHTDYNSSKDFGAIYAEYLEAGEELEGDYPTFYDVVEDASEEFIKGYKALSGCVGWFNLFVVKGGEVVAQY